MGVITIFTEEQVKDYIDKVMVEINKVMDEKFPIEGNKKILEVDRLEVGEVKDIMNLKKHKELKLKDRSLTVPIDGHFILKDKSTDKVVDNKKVRIIRLPVLSPRGSFLIDGNEYQATHQLRLKAGVYTRIADNGEIQSQVNIRNFPPFKVKLDPETQVFTMKVGTSKIGLYPFLKAMGIKDSYIKQYMGEEILETNRREKGGSDDRALKYFVSKILYDDDDFSPDELRSRVRDFFKESELDPETTKTTLGKEFKNVNPDMLLETARKLIKVTKGEEEEDDRDSLSFKKIFGVEDHLKEVIQSSIKKLEKSFKRNVDEKDEVRQIISPKDFNNPIKNFFTTSDLITATEITNPLAALGNYTKVTIMGEGGVKSSQQVTDDMININPSTLGFLDPVHTPESGKIGANLHLSSLVEKDGQNLTTKVIDVKTNKVTKITPQQLEKSVVAFADFYDEEKGKFKRDKVKTLNKKKMDEVPKGQVDYVLVDSSEIFDHTTNMTPFLGNTQGNRAMMGGKMQEQALSLKEREAPLVQSEAKDGVSFEEALGNRNCLKAPADGKITSLDPLTVTDNSGKKHTLSHYDHYPLGGGSMNNHELKVKKGQQVKKGQLLADSSYTKDGSMALGANLDVAFMPYKGFTFEDGLVVSEKGAKKMTSEHLYVEELNADKKHTLDKEKFKSIFPQELDAENDRKLDKEGVIKGGSKVEKGDLLIAAYKEKEVSEADVLLNNIKNKLALDKQNVSIYWDKDVEGVVQDVIRNRNLIKVTIKTEESAKVGDKVVGRYGNKGTITKIIPDEEAPQTEEGKVLDVILNPHTVPSRMNPSQLLETAAAKIAEKTGKPYKVKNFDDENQLEKIKAKMKELGIPEKEKIIDPKEGELENPVFTGKQYMLKLQHQTKKKFSSRSFGQGYDMDEQPLRGGKNSGQALDVLTNYALLAHGAKENLKEMSTIKSQKNDEFWRAFQTGQPLPKPKDNLVFDKFKAHLEGLGVKIHKDNNSYQLMAMTDKDIEKKSNGEIKDAKVIQARTLKEDKGGLFDPGVTGGKEGEHWAHIELEEPIPNPVFEKPIKKLLGLTEGEFKDILKGNEEIDGEIGGKAIEKALGKIDVEKRLEELKGKVDKAPKSKIDDIHKQIRYLDALQRTGRKPTDYIMRKMPVIPPRFRPVYELPDGNLGVSDINELYKHTLLVNDAIRRDRKTGVLDESEVCDMMEDLYGSIEAVEGISDPITYDARVRNKKGILRYIGGTSGTQPKDAFFQSKVVKKRQDLSGRATIVAGPELDVDEIGIPEEMAWEVYKPHIMKELNKSGIPPHKARNDHFEKRSDRARKALQKVSVETPVMLNRAPSLHKFSAMAFKPKIIEGKSIRLPSLTVTGFNADFDSYCRPA